MASPRPIIRQLTFFLLAVLLPSTVLLSFGVVLLRQESELNERRLEEGRTFLARAVGDSLFQALEAAYRTPLDGKAKWTATQPPLLILGESIDGQLSLFRDEPVQAAMLALRSDGFGDFLRSTELQERDRSQLGAVINQYERRWRQESDSVRMGFLELRIARAMSMAGLDQGADEWDLRLLGRPSSITDEYGAPLALYAAFRLLNRERMLDAVQNRVRKDLSSSEWLPPAALIELRDQMAMEGLDGLWNRSDSLMLARISGEQDLASFAHARSVLLMQNASTGASWLPVPGTDWLIRRLPLMGTAPVAAVRLSDLLPPGSAVVDIRRGRAQEPSERELHAGLEGLVADIDDTALRSGESQQWFLMAGLGLVLGLTLFGAYLLWRDVRRETRLSALRTQFVSSVSHELRTPLTSIRLFAETLLEHGGDDVVERERSLSIIANESERLTRMLNNVLNTSRIEQGTMSYRPGPGSLDTSVMQAADAMEYAFRQAGVALTSDVQPVEATFDPDAVEQAVINLLSNALKYGASGGRVELACHRNGTHAHISVQDYGPGISADEQERVFERFYRTQRADDRRVTGAGLGLALVQHIIEGHGGQVTLESQPGSGARFTLSIPLQNLPES